MSNNKEIEIIDNLLTFLTMSESMMKNIDILNTQDQLLKHKWIKDALIYIKEKNPEKLTLSTHEWIERCLK